MKKATMLLFLLLTNCIAFSDELSGSMKDFIRKGHLIIDLDLNTCGFESFIKLYPNYKLINRVKANLPNSSQNDYIENYEFNNFYISVYKWNNSINDIYNQKRYSQILTVKAKKGIDYLDNIKLGMTKSMIESKLGIFSIQNDYSILFLEYYLPLHFVFNKDGILIEMFWQRELGE